MDKLTAVNKILPTLGEAVVTSITSRNPTIQVILNALKSESDTLQVREWWFNTYSIELYPENTGEIKLPSNTISWLSTDNPGIQRGLKVFNVQENSFNWEVGTPIHGDIRVRLDFEELPESAAEVVVNAAAIKAYVDDIGVEDALNVWQQKEMQARMLLESEHLRNRRYSTKRSYRFRNIRRAIGR